MFAGLICALHGSPGYLLHVHAGCVGGEVHPPCHVQAAEVDGHPGGLGDQVLGGADSWADWVAMGIGWLGFLNFYFLLFDTGGYIQLEFALTWLQLAV